MGWETRGSTPARTQRPFPSSCIRPVSSTRLGRTTQRSSAQDMTGYDSFRKGEGSTTRRDGMENGQGTAELFGSLAWALARQTNLVRLACQCQQRIVRQSVSQGQPGNLAPSSCCGSRQQLWSLHVCFFRGQTVCALTRVSMRIDDSNINSNSRRLSAVPYRIVPAPHCTVSCGIVIVSSPAGG